MSPEPQIGTVEQALEALQSGRPVIVVDNPDRENEGDVVLAASRTSDEWVAWTIRHSSGYLCAPMPAERADALDLPLMVPNSEDPRRTAYTVTVDAATGVTTGISAADRHRTLQVLAEPTSTAASVIRPGHVLPLRAVPGGVLHRAGHTEAAVDLCRLADVGEVAGIAELVNDDGTMMRLPQLLSLADRYALIVITIADLIAWRRIHDDIEAPSAPIQARRVEHVSTAKLPTAFGNFLMHGYRDLRTGAEHVALVPVQPPQGMAGQPQLVRVHSECLTGDAFGSLRCDCGPQLHTAMETVAEYGGAIVYLTGQEGRGIGLLPKIQAYALQDNGRDTLDANLDLGYPADRRDYSAAAAILDDLGITDITLLTNNPAKVHAMRSHGIKVSDVRRLEVGVNEHNISYLQTKAVRMSHEFSTHITNGDIASTDADVDRKGQL